MKKFELKTPLAGRDVKKLRCGDIVYLSGTVITARDCAHKRIKEYAASGRKMPFSLEGVALFHAGPIVKNGGIIAIGSTTSARMDEYAPLVFGLGVRAVIGKGGMGEEGSAALKKYCCAYLAWTGGCSAIGREFFKPLKVYWKDLGMAESVWKLKAEKFGPLIVGIDANGKSVYGEVMEGARKKVQKLKFG